jgi:hypothetical protein
LTQNIQVGTTTAPDGWSVSGTLDKVVAVNQPDDDATTFIYAPFGDQQYSLDTHTIPPGSTINSVTAKFRGRSPDADDDIFARLYLGVDFTQGTTYTMSVPWANYSEALARPGGGAWALIDLDTLEIRVSTSGGFNERHVTTLYIEVDYTPPAAGATGDMLLLF